MMKDISVNTYTDHMLPEAIDKNDNGVLIVRPFCLNGRNVYVVIDSGSNRIVLDHKGNGFTTIEKAYEAAAKNRKHYADIIKRYKQTIVANTYSQRREVLYDCLRSGSYCKCSGIVAKASSTKLLLKDLKVSYVDSDWDDVTGIEDHLWIDRRDNIGFIMAKEGDQISFVGSVRGYYRADKSKDFEVYNCSNIKINQDLS